LGETGDNHGVLVLRFVTLSLGLKWKVSLQIVLFIVYGLHLQMLLEILLFFSSSWILGEEMKKKKMAASAVEEN